MTVTKANLHVIPEHSSIIEKGIPCPNIGTRKYPFNQMEVGDSFLVAPSVLDATRNASVAFGKKHGWTFTTKKFEGGYRCWRIA